MDDLTCDVAVIGAGTAGLGAEHHARKAGARTLLIDPVFAGTTCATVGCMPSKLLIAAADAARSANDAESFGIGAHAVVDGTAVMRRLRRERDHFADGVRQTIADIPREIRLQGKAGFTAPGELQLDDGRSVAARAMVIASGASPAIPAAFDIVRNRILTNETLFELDDLPSSVAVIGAGPLGLELGQALARLGVRVEVFDRGGRLAGLADTEVSNELHACLSDEFPIHLGVAPEVSTAADGVALSWQGGGGTFDRLLVAAGRPANLDGLNLGAAGLDLDEGGAPVIDPGTLQCGNAPVFVAGDATGDRPLLHEASHEGVIAGRNAAAYPEVGKYMRHVRLALTFTRPEAATVGEIPAEDDPDRAIATARFADNGRARIEARRGGICRLCARRGDGRLTGAILCAPDGGHLAHLLAWAIGAKLTVAQLLDMPFYHPTLEEALKPALRDLCRGIGDEGDTSRRDDAPGA